MMRGTETDSVIKPGIGGKRRMAWRRHRKGGIIVTTDVYNNNRQKLSLPRYGGLKCPSGYLCPSRVDDDQGEKKQEMKRQGDKKISKKKRKLCVGTWRSWGVKKEGKF
jgi:hypothetical protein